MAEAAAAPASGWAAVWAGLKETGTQMLNGTIAAYGNQLTSQIVAGTKPATVPGVTVPAGAAAAASAGGGLAKMAVPIGIGVAAILGTVLVFRARKR